MARVTFKRIEQAPTSEMEILTTLREYLILTVKVSDYNRDMILKMVRMLIRRYGILSPDEAFGKRVYLHMTETRKSGNYIKNVMRTIELWAASQKTIIKLPKPERLNHRVEFLRPAEARMLLDVADNVRDRAMLAVFLWGGLRCKEIINANVNDYDTHDRLFWVRNNQDADIRYPGVKNKQEQSVVLPAEAHRYLLEYIKERPIVETKALFVTRDGKRFSPRGIDDMIKRTAERAGIKRPVSAHVLRHTMVTLACASNTNLFFVQRQARHSSPKVTELYAHAAADMQMMRTAFDEAATKMF